MKKWIRQYLGLDNTQNYIYAIAQTVARIERANEQVLQLKSSVDVTLTAVGKVISKFDPIYTQSELDPDRKAASDKLGQEVIDKLYAEDAARQQSTGFPSQSRRL